MAEQQILDGLPCVETHLEFGSVTHKTTDDPPAPATPVQIYDARAAADRIELDTHSFQLIHAPTAFTPEQPIDMYDAGSVAEQWYPRMERLLLEQLPGATRVVPFDHLVRNKQLQEELGKGKGLSSPLTAVHGDYTHRSGLNRARQLLSPYETPETLDSALSGRVALVNVWHPLETVLCDPLALCLWGTFGPGDVRTQRLTFPHRVGETYVARPCKHQRWAYFSEVTPEEGILIKTYDSEEDRARFSLHAAFKLPGQDPELARKSIEVRCLVLFGAGLEGLAQEFVPPSVDPANAKAEADEQANRVVSEILPVSDEW